VFSLALVVVVVVFYYLLKDVDLAQVWAEIQAMTWMEDAALAAIAAWNLATYGLLWMSVTPGLGFGRAMVMTQSASAVTNTVPTVGPAIGVGMTYSMLRSWGYSGSRTSVAVLVSGVWNTLAKLGLPVLALALLALQGNARGRGSPWPLPASPRWWPPSWCSRCCCAASSWPSGSGCWPVGVACYLWWRRSQRRAQPATAGTPQLAAPKAAGAATTDRSDIHASDHQPQARPRAHVRHPSDVLRVVLGALILLATMTAIHQDRVGVRETNLFRLLNDLATLLAALDGVADPTLVRATADQALGQDMLHRQDQPHDVSGGHQGLITTGAHPCISVLDLSAPRRGHRPYRPLDHRRRPHPTPPLPHTAVAEGGMPPAPAGACPASGGPVLLRRGGPPAPAAAMVAGDVQH
jgi:hypothetical protein